MPQSHAAVLAPQPVAGRYTSPRDRSMHRITCCVLFVELLTATSARGPDLTALFAGHRWFELRQAVTADSALLYRGAVACAFNDTERCDRLLGAVIRAKPKSDDAAAARELLIYRAQRVGRYREALAEIEALLANDPENASLKGARVLFNALARATDQIVVERRTSTVGYRLKGGNLFVPVSADGRTGSWLVDTGANFSLMSESEARRLGLEIREERAAITDATGLTTATHTAIVNELRVGGVRLRNVAFLIARDDHQPFVDLEPGERAVLGLPVLLTFEAFRWTRDGAFQIGVPSEATNRASSNLCFDGGMPVTRAEFLGRPISMHVDTGATVTHLWPLFAADFERFIAEHGSRSTKRVTGVGNSIDVSAILVPQLTIVVGDRDIVLRPASVLVDRTDAAGDRSHGNLGMDLLRQAGIVTVDFRAMRLTLQ